MRESSSNFRKSSLNYFAANSPIHITVNIIYALNYLAMAEELHAQSQIDPRQVMPSINKAYPKHKQPNKSFILDCCREESKLRIYDSNQDKFLRTYLRNMMQRKRKKMPLPYKPNALNISIAEAAKQSNSLSFHQKQLKILSKKLRSNGPSVVHRAQNPSNKAFLLPELFSTERNCQQLEKIIQNYKNRRHFQRHSICSQDITMSNKADSITQIKNKFTPLSREQFLNTIQKYKTNL
jgi:hypothetical protein